VGRKSHGDRYRYDTGNNRRRKNGYRLSSGKLIGYVGIDMFPAGTEVDARIPRGE